MTHLSPRQEALVTKPDTSILQHRLAPYLLLTGMVAAVFGTSLFHGFVWDDHIYLLIKPAYLAFDLRRIFLLAIDRVVQTSHVFHGDLPAQVT